MRTSFARLGRDFWLFRLGQLISIIGDSCGNIALAWWILDRTGSAAAMSTVLAPVIAARILLLPLFGPLGDWFPRKSLILIADLWRGALTLALTAMVAFDLFHLPTVLILYFLCGVGTALFNSSASPLIPQLVRSENLRLATQQSQAISKIGGLAGGLAGGALVTWIGVKGAFLVNGISFFIAAGATQLIRANTRPASRPREESLHPLKRWASEFVEGFQVLYRIPVLFGISLIAMGMNLALNPIGVALPVLVKQGKGMPPWYLGAIEASLSAGSILGVLSVGWLCRKIHGDRTTVLGILLGGISIGLAAYAPGLTLPLLLFFAMGFGIGASNVPIGTQIALAVPDTHRSRVHSVMGFLCEGVSPLGVALIGLAINAWGIQPTLALMGVSIAALAPAMLFVPHFKAFFRASPEEAKTFFILPPKGPSAHLVSQSRQSPTL